MNHSEQKRRGGGRRSLLLNGIGFAVMLLVLVSLPSIRADTRSEEGPPQSAQENASGSIRVKSDLLGAEVLLDGEEAGRTPLTLRSVPAGGHRLTVRMDGYKDHAQLIQIAARKRSSVFIVMEPLETALPRLPVEFEVIHQHRFGRCVGVLTVTAEAVDYRSVHNKDVFHFLIRVFKSVSRSWGPVAGMGPSGINAPTDAMAVRIETPGRAYGFAAYQKEDDNRLSFAPAPTKELFETVYKLWTATLKSREKGGSRHEVQR